MSPIDYRYINGQPCENFDYSWIYNQAEKLKNIDPTITPKSWQWYNNNWTPINILLRYKTDPNTNEEVKYTIDYSEQVLKDTGFDNPIAFDAIRQYTNTATRTLLIYAGKGKETDPINLGPGQVQAHLHTPERNSDGSYKGPRMTATVIIPIKIVEPVTETLCFAWQNIPYETMNINEDALNWESSLSLLDTYNDLSNVQRIKFPEMGQYLTFYFDSSHYLHWSELDTNNEFICLVQDC